MPKRQRSSKEEKTTSGLDSWMRNICRDLGEFRHANMTILVGIRNSVNKRQENLGQVPQMAKFI